MCTPEAYLSLVPNAAVYTRPTNPGRLTVIDGLTEYQIAQIRDKHAESMRVFCEVLGIERAIILQMVIVIDQNFYVH